MNETLLLMLAAPAFGILSYGFLMGLRHATEADHLAAVSAIVSERRSLFSAALVGGLWGIGHTISLIVAGVLVLIVEFEISPRAEHTLEFCVGVMLTLLGLNVLRKVIRGDRLHFHTHGHGARHHVHPHFHDEAAEPADSHHGFALQPRSLVVGMVHGLAGSAALILLVLPTVGSRGLGLLYLLIFGVGSIAGMSIMTFLVGLPFYLTAKRFERLNGALQVVAGAVGIILGLSIMYENGFADRTDMPAAAVTLTANIFARAAEFLL